MIRLKLTNFLPGEFLFGTPSYHFLFVVALNRVPRSVVRCGFVSHVIDPNLNMNQIHIKSIYKQNNLNQFLQITLLISIIRM